MDKPKELHIVRWNYNVYELEGRQIITVAFFGRVDYPRSFYLERQVGENEYSALKGLAEEIRNNYEHFKPMEIVPPVFE